TSLSTPEEAVDRLLLEPVAAAPDLPHGDELIDLGSGGGSPAIPLALATGASRLVMVESRGRKAAFLRETLRELKIHGSVATSRFEDLTPTEGFHGSFGLLSVRAVRVDESLLSSISSLLRPQGVAALFGAQDRPVALPSSLAWLSTKRLMRTS